MNLELVFLTGLTTGGISCLAVQGGLLASVIANQKKSEIDQANSPLERQNLKRFDQRDYLPVAMFLGAKLISHFLAGLALGALGSAITLSLGMQLTFQALAAIFMAATALNLLGAHGSLRRLSFQPPAFINRFVIKTSESSYLFAPALLGFLTILIPCGVTQAMQVLAISTASPLQGGLIMGVFVIGTMPIFAALGIATARLSESWQNQFKKFAAALLIMMALYSLNGVLVVLNSPITWQSLTNPVRYFFSSERFSQANLPPIVDGKQQITIAAVYNGYEPKLIQVRAGVPVELTLVSNDTYSCALAFLLRDFGIEANLRPTDRRTFEFTPNRPGRYTYTCTMGMYSGILEVVEAD